MRIHQSYDVIVVGAGHAGCEAALAASRLGLRTLMLTMSLDTIAQMSCNPAIGGLGKGQLVREIDALGGVMGRAIDATGIQFRMLNASKGPASQGPRAQADKRAYAAWMKLELERQPGLTVRQHMVDQVRVEAGRVVGVGTREGLYYAARAVVITAGTFLKGLVHVGLARHSAGRGGEASAEKLSDSFRDHGIAIARFKTGTPPRLNGRTLDLAKTERQDGDLVPTPFSFGTDRIDRPQVPCWLTWTTPASHEIVRGALDRSPLYAGIIEGTGPRYCPSIEDKVVKFAERERHQVFLEPEGANTLEWYVNGISTSIPPDAQDALVRSIPGCEQAEIIRYGYAIEYDYAPPTQLDPSLETKAVRGLYFAGQVNGTSGYEEAGAQGLVAGINAALALKSEPPLVLRRDEAYVGVMIDDLVTHGAAEPYRMFTSRAEYRLLLRHDNADRRLVRHAARVGLASALELGKIEAYEAAIADVVRRLEARQGGPPSLARILGRPESSWKDVVALDPELGSVPPRVATQVETEVKYAGYVERQAGQIAQMARLDGQKIPASLDYAGLTGMRNEAREKFSRVRPPTIGHASRIPGITPADVSLLAIHAKVWIGQKEAAWREGRGPGDAEPESTI